jgi:O-methyltransferase domain
VAPHRDVHGNGTVAVPCLDDLDVRYEVLVLRLSSRWDSLEEKYRAVAHLPRFLKETRYRSPSRGNVAFNAVYSTPLNFYTYSAQFDHGAALNFARSMEELARSQLPFFANSYPLDRLPPASHFVDVAGGLGNLSYFLAERLPQAVFEVQDLPFIVEQADNACAAALKHRVSFKAQDMFAPQPRREKVNGTRLVYLLKIVLHDHGDEECKVILQNLLSTMNKGDRILIIDVVTSDVGGSLSSCYSDLIILSMFGSGHRTLKEFLALINDCGEGLVVTIFTGGTEESDGMMVIEIQKG